MEVVKQLYEKFKDDRMANYTTCGANPQQDVTL
jgi:hypothetical protein